MLDPCKKWLQIISSQHHTDTEFPTMEIQEISVGCRATFLAAHKAGEKVTPALHMPQHAVMRQPTATLI
eukprot:366259-Chlamydomonas_euryale.AAC.2